MKTLKTFSILSILLLQSPLAFGETTESCQIDVSKLQSCPKKNLRMVPKNYQPQILYLGYAGLGSNFEFLEALPEGTMVAISGASKESLQKKIRKELPPAKARAIEAKLLYYPHSYKEPVKAVGLVPEVDNEQGGYIRDLAVLGFDPSTGEIQYNFQKRHWHPEGDELKLCGLKAKMNDLGSGFFNPGFNRGGNVMALPGGQCLVGSNMESDRAQTLCGQGEGIEIVRIPTLGTTVGHIDELVNIIPSSKPAPCNFQIVIADQETHSQILRDNPNELFFREGLIGTNKNTLEEFYSDPNHCQQNGCPAELPQKRVCDLYRANATIKYFQKKLTSEMYEGAPGTPEKTRSQDKASLDQFINLFFSEAKAAAKKLGSKDPAEEAEKKRAEDERKAAIASYGIEYSDEVKDELKRSMKPCSKLTNKDVLEALEASDFSPMKKFIEKQDQKKDSEGVPVHQLLKESLYRLEGAQKSNQKIAESLDKTREILAQNIPAECRSEAFTKLPYLFIDAKAVNPNPANVEAAGNVVITPEQITPAVGEYIQKQYEKMGMKPFSMNTFSKHTGGGNVHCLTNELRLCNPL